MNHGDDHDEDSESAWEELTHDERWDAIFPASFTYQRYKNGRGMGFQIPIPELQIKIQTVVAKCPNSLLPYFSLQCAGDGCMDLLKPCNNDADCGGASNTAVKCYKLLKPEDLDAKTMFEGMAETDMIFSKEDPGRFNADSVCRQQYGRDGILGMVKELKTFFRRKFFFDQTAAADTGVAMCAWSGRSADPSESDKDHMQHVMEDSGESMTAEKDHNGGTLLSPFFPFKLPPKCLPDTP